MEINKDIHIKTKSQFQPYFTGAIQDHFKMVSTTFFIFSHVLREIWPQIMKCDQIYYSL